MLGPMSGHHARDGARGSGISRRETKPLSPTAPAVLRHPGMRVVRKPGGEGAELGYRFGKLAAVDGGGHRRLDGVIVEHGIPLG